MWEVLTLSKIYTASAPGSLMLMGEHAVLQGYGALAMAINKRITVRVIRALAHDKHVIIRSALGLYTSPLDCLKVQKPFQFVLMAIAQHRHKLSGGFTLEIESEFSDTVGLGSSAAVTVATLAALSNAFNLNLNLFEAAKEIVRAVQGGIGSGADIAASISGGVVHYHMKENVLQKNIKPIAILPPIVVVYTGSKKPTTEVVALVENKRKQHPTIYQSLFKTIDACVQQACAFLHAENWSALGEVMDLHHGIMTSIGLSNKVINDVVVALKSHLTIYGAKISGSGLGDCVVGLGTVEEHGFPEPMMRMDCAVSLDGLHYE